jgi:hypothetical protein
LQNSQFAEIDGNIWKIREIVATEQKYTKLVVSVADHYLPFSESKTNTADTRDDLNPDKGLIPAIIYRSSANIHLFEIQLFFSLL